MKYFALILLLVSLSLAAKADPCASGGCAGDADGVVNNAPDGVGGKTLIDGNGDDTDGAPDSVMPAHERRVPDGVTPGADQNSQDQQQSYAPSNQNMPIDEE